MRRSQDGTPVYVGDEIERVLIELFYFRKKTNHYVLFICKTKTFIISMIEQYLKNRVNSELDFLGLIGFLAH